MSSAGLRRGIFPVDSRGRERVIGSFPGFFGKVPHGIIRGSEARKSLSWLRKVLIFAITKEFRFFRLAGRARCRAAKPRSGFSFLTGVARVIAPPCQSKSSNPAPSSDRGCRAAAPASARTRFSGIDDGDGLDLDHEIGSGETGNADGRAGRGRHSEIAHSDVGALLELVEVGDKGVGLDDVGPGGAGRLEAPVEVVERLFHLRAHVASADAA